MPLSFAFGDFEIDEARFELRRRGEPVRVQPKVLDLIVYLATHRDRVVTKDELLDKVWHGVAVTEASLIQATSLARRALDDTPTEQRVIRTVRNKGFQFVATEKEKERTRSAEPEAAGSLVRERPGLTALETEEDAAAARSRPAGSAPHLFAVLDCEALDSGGSSWSLADVDEVVIVRGSKHRARRIATGAQPRVLELTVPGRFISRQHARLVRTPLEWLVLDEGSRNGTFVNGVRVERRRALAPNDVVECGRVLYRFSEEPRFLGTPPELVTSDVLVPSVTPSVVAVTRELERVARSPLSILLIGESGVGKSHVARAIHELSGASEPFVVLDEDASMIERATRATILVENVERISPPIQNALMRALESKTSVRVIATTTLSLTELQQRVRADLLARLSGFRCTIPPLRERIGDLGVVIASVLRRQRSAMTEIDIAVGRAFTSYGWPGNLHELRRTLELATVLAGGAPIGIDHLPRELRPRYDGSEASARS